MGTIRETFPDKRQGDILGASHVNKLNRAARDFSAFMGGTYSIGEGARLTPFPPYIQLPVEVITEGCDGDSDLFEVQPFYYDHDATKWKTNDEDGPFCLDPTLFDLSFAVGDKLTAWWNPQRDAFMPVSISICDTIDFTIISADCNNKTALVQIDARNCGCSKVPKEDDLKQVTVNDSKGCNLDEPNADLVGRKGVATYKELDYDGTCQWEIDNLCCDPNICV